MNKDEKKGFIRTLFVFFTKHTLERKNAQAKSLSNTTDKRIVKILDKNGNIKIISGCDIKKGNIILVEAGDIIPSDGEVIEGLALVDESAITGESVPVMKEAGGEFNLVISGTRIASNWLKIKVTEPPVESCFDKIVSVSESTAI
ncbi:hypothetical protein [Clostridium magnum]|uniref:Potassium-transporting ATPase B chain n=1 Tax=Clostridium magnum DSM 2767 TaxID=1121326 RepID=A0A162SWQ1_9CLOT|nr:hypothetical protein [Clostridium magnum]KZL91963.1 potassium-transporting ATPase B chain [Clostridium magnum DSM 2767]SHH28200.1 ATPase, P-type (transporting), HAD superfamily, subfamily IC [Clostridium magnum DSM 2767]